MEISVNLHFPYNSSERLADVLMQQFDCCGRSAEVDGLTGWLLSGYQLSELNSDDYIDDNLTESWGQESGGPLD